MVQSSPRFTAGLVRPLDHANPMKAWISASSGLSLANRDCRRASAANPGACQSGTQIDRAASPGPAAAGGALAPWRRLAAGALPGRCPPDRGALRVGSAFHDQRPALVYMSW